MIYLNNAASSYPKPRSVTDAVLAALSSPPANPYRENCERDPSVQARRNVAKLLGVSDPERVVFTSGATESLHLCIEGLAKENSRIITTEREHTSTLRPIWKLEKEKNCQVCVLPAGKTGLIDAASLVDAINDSTSLVCVNHVSNVNGSAQDLYPLYDAATSRGAVFLVDLAQSAGCVQINADEMPDAVFVFTGHKALLGPCGTGGFALGKNVEMKVVKPGGSGVHSALREMPDIMPLKYEAGTPNSSGIAGLGASTGYLLDAGFDAARGKLRELTAALLEGLRKINKVRLFAADEESNPCGIASFTIDGWSARDAGYLLDQSFDIRVRTGLHCAPLMAKALGLDDEGSIRASVSIFTTTDEIGQFCDAVEQISRSST